MHGFVFLCLYGAVFFYFPLSEQFRLVCVCVNIIWLCVYLCVAAAVADIVVVVVVCLFVCGGV